MKWKIKMMKSILINIGIIAGIFLIYYLDLFGWFATKNALIFSFALVILVFIVAWKVLGNPFAGDKKDGDE